MMASPSSFTTHHSLDAAAALCPPSTTSPSLSTASTNSSSTTASSTLTESDSHYSQDSSADSSCPSPPTSSALTATFEQHEAKQHTFASRPAGRTGSLLHTKRRQARPRSIQIPDAAVFLRPRPPPRCPSRNSLLAEPCAAAPLSDSLLRDAAATAADEALEREIERATKMPAAAAASSGRQLEDWRRNTGSDAWHKHGSMSSAFVDEEAVEVLETPGIHDCKPLVGQRHNSFSSNNNGGSNEAFNRLTRSSSTGVLSATTPSASRIARGAHVPATLKLDVSNHVTIISSAPAPDDLPGAKARRILGIDAGSGGWDKSPTRLESGYESSSGGAGGGGARTSIASMVSRSALKKMRSVRRRSQSSQQHQQQQSPFAHTPPPPMPSKASLSAPLGASASRFFRRSSQMPLAVPSHSHSDRRASLESPPSPLPGISSGGATSYYSPSPSYSIPASPSPGGYSDASSPASMSTDVIVTPVSASRPTFAFGLKDRSSPRSKVSPAVTLAAPAAASTHMSQVSPDDDELWQRQLQLIERNATWQTSIEHRPRPRQPTLPASAAPLRRADECSSSDEALHARRPTSDRHSRKLSTSSVSRRPSFDPHPLHSPSTPLSRSTSMDRLPRGIFESPRAAPREPSLSGTRSSRHSNASSLVASVAAADPTSVEYVDYTSAPVSRRPSMDASSINMPALTHSGSSISSGTIDSLASRRHGAASPPPYASAPPPPPQQEVYATLALPPVPPQKHQQQQQRSKEEEREDNDRPFISFDVEQSDSEEEDSSTSLHSAASACLRRRRGRHGDRGAPLSVASHASSDCLPEDVPTNTSDAEDEAGVILLALADEAPQLHFRMSRRSRARLSFPSSAISLSDTSERDLLSPFGSPVFARMGLASPTLGTQQQLHGVFSAEHGKLDGLGFREEEEEEENWRTPTRPTAQEAH